VLPGQYSVSLTIDGKSYTQALDLRMDPRVKSSPDDLRRQFDLDRKIADALHRDYQAVQQVRALRAQLKALATKNPNGELAKKIGDTEKKAAALEGEGDGARFLSTPEGRSLARLNAGFATVLSALDSADAAPTTQQSAMVGELEKALAEQLAAWEQLKSKDVAELNAQLKQSGSAVIDRAKVEASTADSVQTTTQDKDRDVE
jgi:hypothetical protein